ncbi:NAD(P)-binding protein [Neoconidiobolus thromboides FSU 785]|nr:NAD(P)-binding protein [Neoconidiobolus thromboides FSU 785]
MSTSTIPKEYQRVVIAGGTGAIGRSITEELLKNKDIRVKILTRASSGEDTKKELKEKYVQAGGELVEIDYNSQKSLMKALEGTDVVISALNTPDFAVVNNNLIDASVKSKVKLFIPSEFGGDIEGVENPFIFPKQAVRKHLESSGLDYIYYNNGFFIEHLLVDLFGIDIRSHEARIIGTGDTKLTVTSINDVGRFVAQTYFLPETRNQFVDIIGENTTINKILKNISEISGKPFKVEKIPIEEANKVINDKNTDSFAVISYLFGRDIENGGEYLKGNSNHILPNFKFLSVKEYVKQAFFS